MTAGRLVAGLAVASVAGVIAVQAVGARTENVSLVLTAVFGSLGLSPFIKDHVRPRGAAQAAPPAETTMGISGVDLYWSPALVVVAVVAALQIIERVTAAFAAFAASWGYGAVGLPAEEPILVAAAVTGAGLVAIVAQSLLVIPVAYWAAHRLERRSLAWIALAVLVSQLLSVAVVQLLFGYPSAAAALQHLAFGLALLPGAALGAWIGERSKLDYGMSLIYGRLAARDQLDLLEMARHAGEAASRPAGPVTPDSGSVRPIGPMVDPPDG